MHIFGGQEKKSTIGIKKHKIIYSIYKNSFALHSGENKMLKKLGFDLYLVD